MARDYEKLGLKVGLEIHQQLASGTKLFCDCPLRRDDGVIQVSRKLRAVPGELGQVDPAAAHEYLRDKTFIYEMSPDSACLVELDEQPPKPMNRKALDLSIQISKLLNCRVVGELHDMRKTVIDGSAVSGFQRTALVARNGHVETSFGRLGIQTIMIEEDSATPVQQKNGTVRYRLDRLGIPLVEIATEPGIHTPEQAKEAAEKIGLLIRSASVRRGIGTIRQDINISIPEGARVEMKGFQELGDIPGVIENEVERQLALLEMKKELKKRGVKKVQENYVDVTSLFRDTKNRTVSRLALGGKVYAAKLSGFSGFLSKKVGDRTFGKELASYAEAHGSGIIHTDEDHGMTDEFREIGKKLNPGKRDVMFISVGPLEAVQAVLERANEAVRGVPEETRVADGTGSRYTRPLPGAGRLYPESDVPSVVLSSKYVQSVKELVPLPAREKKLAKSIGKEMASQLVRSEYLPLFEELRKYGDRTVAAMLLSHFRDMKRDGVDPDKIPGSDLEGLLKEVKRGSVAKNSLPEALRDLAKGKPVKRTIEKYRSLPEKDLKKIVRRVVSENKDAPMSALMGMIMDEVGGRAAGKKVAELLKKELSRK